MASLSLCSCSSPAAIPENHPVQSKFSNSSNSTCSSLHLSPKTILKKTNGIFSIASKNHSAKSTSSSLNKNSFIVHASGSALRDQAEANASLAASAPEPDAFVSQLIQTLTSNEKEDSLLIKLRESSSELASSMKWPTNRDESYRFTDLRPIKNCKFSPTIPLSSESNVEVDMGRFALQEANGWRLVLVDGKINLGLSHLPEDNKVEREGGVLIGALNQLSDEQKEKYVAKLLGFSNNRKSLSNTDLFSALNGVATSEVLVIAIPASVKAPKPVHIIHLSTGSGDPGTAYLSSPRLLVIAEENAHVEIVEEFAALSVGCYWVNSVAEISVAAGAVVSHSLVQQEARDSFHIRKTYVEQAEGSKYSFIETQLGSQISRHNFQMIQSGKETETNVSTFSLVGNRQLHDLHSSLILNHPRGKTSQIHKCIVTDSSGHAVFDGNVKVNRLAQQTDAGQLSRSLLLAPRGTVNIKPNLQIIADDVKCTHGAAISDLEEDQIFYFQARGIDEVSARSALVYSFGAEVLGKIRFSDLRTRLEVMVKAALAAEGAMDSTIAAGLGASQ